MVLIFLFGLSGRWDMIAEETTDICDGSETDWGKNGLRTDDETREGCKAACKAAKGCAFIVWKPEKERCMLHKDCETRHIVSDGNRADILQLVLSSPSLSASPSPSASSTPSASPSKSASLSQSASSSPSTSTSQSVSSSPSTSPSLSASSRPSLSPS